MEKFTLFYGGIFSQWAHSPFTVDGVRYNCAEQYMMAQKARLFGDSVRLDRIMATQDPSQQKALGKKVLRFRKSVWESVARDVVMRGSLAKFTSTPDLYEGLMETRGTLLVEASPTDVIWGIGVAEHDPDALDRAKWRGLNWLGQALTDLRLHFEGLEQQVARGFVGEEDLADRGRPFVDNPRSAKAAHLRDLEEDAQKNGGHP
jgi:ribA/ribD-fused uncharacterized protein